MINVGIDCMQEPYSINLYFGAHAMQSIVYRLGLGLGLGLVYVLYGALANCKFIEYGS
jgi:hypothetical protein